MSLNELNYDVLWHVLEHLNVKDSGRLAQTAKRYACLVHHFRRIQGAELVAAVSNANGRSAAGVCPFSAGHGNANQLSTKEVINKAVESLYNVPNLAMCFSTMHSTLHENLPDHLPLDTVVVGSISSTIQTSGVVPDMGGGRVECTSHSSIFLGRIPEDAKMLPFLTNTRGSSSSSNNAFLKDLAKTAEENGEEWKVFMVYGCGGAASQIESFLQSLQTMYPKAVIVGGITAVGYVSQPLLTNLESLSSCKVRDLKKMLRILRGDDTCDVTEKSELVQEVKQILKRKKLQRLFSLEQVSQGIFGLALSGNVPFRSVVSRGVTSYVHKGKPQAYSPLQVARPPPPTDDEMSNNQSSQRRGRATNSAHISSTYQKATAENGYQGYHLLSHLLDGTTGTTHEMADFLARHGNWDYYGIQRTPNSGFELYPLSYQTMDGLILPCDESQTGGSDDENVQSLEGAAIDFFDLDGQACMDHMSETMEQLKRETKNENLLAAIMISCNGRGPAPHQGLIPETMSDATRFHRVFPDVPCLGFYAGGEIGPLARAAGYNRSITSSDENSVFQSGGACLQGFTAVFAVFVVPKVDLSAHAVDDSPAQVDEFVQCRYG